MKGFILKSEQEIIAVLKTTNNVFFFKNVKQAIADHYACKYNEISLLLNDDKLNEELHNCSFEVTIIKDHICNIPLSLIETFIY